jgi:hypothetical protein
VKPDQLLTTLPDAVLYQLEQPAVQVVFESAAWSRWL